MNLNVQKRTFINQKGHNVKKDTRDCVCDVCIWYVFCLFEKCLLGPL